MDARRVWHLIADDLAVEEAERETVELLAELDAYLGAWNDFARLYGV